MARLVLLTRWAGLLALTCLGMTTAAQAAAAPDPATAVVAVPSGDGLRLLDPATGADVTPSEVPGGFTGAAASSASVVFGSAPAADADATDLYAVRLATGETEPIGRMDGQRIIAGLAPSGDRLLLLPAPTGPEWTPEMVVAFDVPAEWQGGTPVGNNSREWAHGILAPTGDRWYSLQAVGPKEAPQLVLRIVAFADGQAAFTTDFPMPEKWQYPALLLAPDGQSLYSYNWSDEGRQFVYVIDVRDPAAPSMRELIAADWQGRKPFFCRAALSPGGDRLYLAEPAGALGRCWIDVYDTATGARLASLETETPFQCIAVAPDGKRVYATTNYELATIDLPAGNERGRVPLPQPTYLCPCFLVFAAAA